MAAASTGQPCKRCKTENAPYKMRNLATCQDCYVEHVVTKFRKSIGIMHKEIRTTTDLAPRRYLAGLSFGTSSTCLTQLLDDTAAYHAGRQSSSPFEPLIVHVDTDLAAKHEGREDMPAQRLLAKYRQKYPHVSFDCVHLSRALALKTVDWSTLVPARTAEEGSGEESSTTDAERLCRIFDALPSVTSRADVLRLLIRHILIDTARERGCTTLLLGHSTSALAALTLAEVANGRGFSVPGLVSDGLQAVCRYGDGEETARIEFPVYYPLRELLKGELGTYMGMVPSLAEMNGELGGVSESAAAAAAVVSHRDVSIEEVMQRYFDGVEGPYSGIVANVVRTAGKLDKVAGKTNCRLCGMTLDESGDDRWAGDLGRDSGDSAAENHKGKLCYGCRRSVSG